jgi:uncharacterized membrane protein
MKIKGMKSNSNNNSSYSPNNNSNNSSSSANRSFEEWQIKKFKMRDKEILDDGTQSFFWRAHTITVLFIMMAVLFYIAVIEEQVHDHNYNIKRLFIFQKNIC